MNFTSLFDLLLGAASFGQASSPDIPWLRIGLVLVLCIVLAFAAVGFLRLRYGMPFLPERFVSPIRATLPEGESKDRLAIIERLPAGPSSQFVILSRGEQRYLIHISQQGAALIDQFKDETAQESET